jgi:hypothetical protein
MEDVMPEELPIACSLTAAEFPARMAQVAAVGEDALLDTDIAGVRARLRFAAAAGVRERVEAFAEAEQRCCPFLSFDVTDAPDAVLLRIDAPDEARASRRARRRVRDPPAGRVLAVEPSPRRRSDAPLAAGAVLMVLCCAVGPGVIGAVAGSAVGGWLGIACAVILAAAVGLLIHRRVRRRGVAAEGRRTYLLWL